MPWIGHLLIVIGLLGAAPTASAQVINGESTYGDSDLHKPPPEAVPQATSEDRRAAARQEREQDSN